MIFEVVFTKKANETFDAICSQLLERWDEKVVAEFERRTLKVIDIISKYPLVYQSVKIDPNIRKAFIHKNCSLFYKIKDTKVVVTFFWANRQKPIL
jgi:plasmid stabilization system protein ParE